MTQSVAASNQFRQKFKIVCKDLLRWFPGHMTKAIADMQRRLKSIDCVIEVHDARIPLSGRDPYFFKRIVGPKPHILVLNKKDLIPNQCENVIVEKLKETGVNNVIFTNCKNLKCRGIKKIVPLAADLISDSERYNRQSQLQFKLMVVGIPNVGKSSVINTLRSKHLKLAKCAPVGGIAGITRAVQTGIRVSGNPNMILVDTPGILSPNVPDADIGMRLALCSNLPDHLVGIENIADYALYILNKNLNFSYVDCFDLDGPSDSILQILSQIARKDDKFLKMNDPAKKMVLVPDYKYAAQKFTTAARTGTFGKILLDSSELGINMADIVSKKSEDIEKLDET